MNLRFVAPSAALHPRRALRLAVAAALLASSSFSLTACEGLTSPTVAPPASSPEAVKTSAGAPSGSASIASRPSASPSSASSAAPVASAADTNAKARDVWSDLVQRLSEPDASFFSDNLISNETSYLQIAADLPKRAKSGGAYIGVGPEQNFTYIAMTKPSVAFIVDIRRQNMLLHLLYKSIFQEAKSRSHFVSLLVGRPYDAASDPGPGASIEAVLAHVEKSKQDEALFAADHTRLIGRIEADYKIALDATDKKNLDLMHRSFLRDQLEIRFELKANNGRKYPTLRELVTAADPAGNKAGFLASEDAFRFVQTLEREHKIIPVVGDFAGDRAMPGVAAYLTEQKVNVSAFYVSNVEQYLFENNVWPKWIRNINAFPSDGESLFIRAYLDQGKKHPSEMKGHRTATILQKMADFKARQEKKPWQSFWAVSTEGVL